MIHSPDQQLSHSKKGQREHQKPLQPRPIRLEAIKQPDQSKNRFEQLIERLKQSFEKGEQTERISTVEKQKDPAALAYEKQQRRIEEEQFNAAKKNWFSLVDTREIPVFVSEDVAKEQTKLSPVVKKVTSPTEENVISNKIRYLGEREYTTNASNITLQSLVRNENSFVPRFVSPEKTFHEKKVSLAGVLAELHSSRRDIQTELKLFLLSQGTTTLQNSETAFSIMKYAYGLPLPSAGEKALVYYYLLHDVYHFTNVKLVQGGIKVKDPDEKNGENSGPATWIQWKDSPGDEYYLDVENAIGIKEIRNYQEFLYRRGGFQKVDKEDTTPRMRKIKINAA